MQPDGKIVVGGWGASLSCRRCGNSYLKTGQFNVVRNTVGSGFISTISWASVPGRLYSVERSFEMNSWLTVADNVQAPAPLNTVTDQVVPPNGKVFYRVVAK